MLISSALICFIAGIGGVLPPSDRPAATLPSEGPDMRVMTFNIRCATANDGENNWVHRRENFFATVRAFDPDILGAQEVVAQQADELQRAFPEYSFVGVGRDDGKRAGEFSPILYRTGRFELVDSGTIWLSDTPDVIGSKGWDAALPRIATWVVLRERKPVKSGEVAAPPLLVLNTHWDHEGVRARAESAKLLRARATGMARERKLPIIMMGDFNCTDESEPYALLCRPAGDTPGFIDGYRVVHPTRSADEATFHAFTGKPTGARIDFILHSAGVTTLESKIDRNAAPGGRFPSDHFAVSSVLRYTP